MQYWDKIEQEKKPYNVNEFIEWLTTTYEETIEKELFTIRVAKCADCIGGGAFRSSFLGPRAEIRKCVFKEHYKRNHKDIYKYVMYVNNNLFYIYFIYILFLFCIYLIYILNLFYVYFIFVLHLFYAYFLHFYIYIYIYIVMNQILMHHHHLKIIQ